MSPDILKQTSRVRVLESSIQEQLRDLQSQRLARKGHSAEEELTMTARQNGTSSFYDDRGRSAGINTGSRPSTANSTRGEQKEEIWSNLLKSVSSHKSIPTRHLLVMGILLSLLLY